MNLGFNISTKELFKILDKGIVDRAHRKNVARHISIKEFDLDLNPEFPKKIREMRGDADSVKSDVCVVYSIWNNFEYVKYAYLSILSNYLCTDLERFELKVLIGGEIAEFDRYLKPFFESLGAEVLMDKDLEFKYTIPRVYSNYDAVFNVDADIFFLGGYIDLYSKLYKRYKMIEKDSFFKTPYLVYGEDRFSSFDKRFHLPMRVVGPQKFGFENLDSEKFLDFWVNEVDFLSLSKEDIKMNFNSGWIWNIFSLYTPSLFNNSKFEKLYNLGKELEIWDDEFLYNLYFWDEDIPTLYLKNFNDLNFVIKDHIPDEVPEDKVSITHPTNTHDPKVKKIYRSIENDFHNL